MAMRSALSRLAVTRSMESPVARVPGRYFNDGRILSDEERAAENVYIKRMEKERLEKLKLKLEKQKAENEKELERLEKEKAELEKEGADKKPEGSQA